MPQTINNKIQRAFSNSAGQYDLFARLHREIGEKLLAQVTKEPQVHALLDVGCGTGYLTALARNYFPHSRIVGLDFAEGMLKAAEQKYEDMEWVLGDAHSLPFPDGSFDILISNLAFQWAGDILRAFAQARRVLVPGGVLACTLFGFHTCDELFRSLDESKTGSLKFKRLPDEDQVIQALVKAGFKDPTVEHERIKVRFKDMYALLAWLKSIGANNLPREGYAGREVLNQAASIYDKRFADDRGVYATFEVIWAYARK